MKFRKVQHRNQQLMLVLLLALPASMAGCGASGPELAPVAGMVTFGGRPVETGDIVLRPSEGAGRAYAGKITDGRFEFDAEPGSKRVEITARRQSGEVDTSNPGEEVPVLVQYIPPVYNRQSTLTLNLPPDGKEDIELVLKPSGP